MGSCSTEGAQSSTSGVKSWASRCDLGSFDSVEDGIRDKNVGEKMAKLRCGVVPEFINDGFSRWEFQR